MSQISNLKFINHLTNDINLLEKLIEDGKLEDFGRIGAEQEFCILDNNFRANPINSSLLKRFNTKDFVTEIAKFNMELNIKPIDINKNCLEQLENILLKKMQLASKKAEDLNSEIIMTGILPTVRKYDLRFENITKNKRYFELCEAINTIRGEKYKLRIRGLDELVFQHDSPLVEGCNTGYQFHLQIGPKDFTKMYNISQLIAAPVLAISTNSPLLFGKRLWHETRIAVFQQSTDTRIIGNYHPETLPRVTFGNEWVNKSIIEIFKEDIIRYKILLNKLTKLNQKEKIPKMQALSLHNSTVYRWNRPCYGIYKGKPSLRIESRMFPSGPTILDQVANSAFWLGLMIFYKHNHNGFIGSEMDFRDARTNFYGAAQQGIDSTFKWFNGKRIAARKLILNDLIPKAAIGLARLNIKAEDIDKYLNIIKERTISRQTGSRWMIDSFDNLTKKASTQNALTTITSEIIENQNLNIPVHKWKTSKQTTVINNPSNLLVEECMDRYIYSVYENESIELAQKINEWKKHNYIVVVNRQGEVTGEITKKELNNFKQSKNTFVKEVMNKKVTIIQPNEKICEAIKIMNQKKLSMLPVCEKKLFIGMLQKKFLTQYEFSKNTIKEDNILFKQENRVIGNYHTGKSKKTILFICGIHGNELSGKKALENIFTHLETNEIEIKGNLIALQGNLNAIEKKERFINKDLNRIWKTKYIEKLKNIQILKNEDLELKKIYSIIETIIKQKKKENLIIIDLHNTSSQNGLFTIVNNEKEAKIASFINIPCITKLFTKVRGSLAQYYNSKGITSLVFEGGTIGDPASIHNHETGMYQILEKMKFIKKMDVPKRIMEEEKKMNFVLKKEYIQYKVKYIHKINSEDKFIMKSNVANFQDVKKNEVLGIDKLGEVKSPINGKILMPLYQTQGSEGFYIIQ